MATIADQHQLRIVMEYFNWHQVILIFVGILAIYHRFTSERSLHILVPEPKFEPMLPGAPVPEAPDVSSNDYTQLIDIVDFRFEDNFFPCDSATSGLLLLVIVSTNPSNFDRRRIIRETWGSTAEATRIVFLIGNSSDAQTSHRISQENRLNGDIIRGNFQDAYRNMTYKHVMGLKWVTYHCPNARYILKMDDDAVVNADELRGFLANEIGPWGARGLIACQVLKHSKVMRSYRSKWRVSPAEYPNHYYPDYCAGWAILYSADVVKRLYIEAQKAKYFWVDDVHITGVLAEQAAIARTPFGELQLSATRMEMVKTFRYDPSHGVFLFGPPDLSVALMSQLWNIITNT